jgi:biopolymer transport protein ExbD
MSVRRVAALVGLGCLVLVAFFMTARALGVIHNTARSETADTADQTVVAIDAHNRLYVNTLPTPADELVRRVQQAIAGLRDKRVYLRADNNARYATVLDTLEDLRAAGINVSLVAGRP